MLFFQLIVVSLLPFGNENDALICFRGLGNASPISNLPIKEKPASSTLKEDIKNKNYIFPRVWINEEYNKHELPPTENNEPIRVNVSLYLSSIIKIDDPTQVL